ncbi:MAG: hypothetical protein CSA39_00640 [Flavobacteriales bacterium]|nr:MAG: hypothetical protein CR989_01025 [Flavobacteriales bacterium]PIE49798.1 MAG: hypothetical protein CSA39_00640 [Flavobacteriales bacterium]
MINKAKKILFFLIKLSIVSGAFYFLYTKLTQHHHLNWQQLTALVERQFNIWMLLLILSLFTIANWTLEGLKWQNLVHVIKPISLANAIEQSLGSLTASLITPNRIGEYGAKAIYYKKGNRRKVMLLNLIGNMTQMGVTLMFGLLGLIGISIFLPLPKKGYPLPEIAAMIAFITLLFSVIFLKYNRKIHGFYLQKIVEFIKNRPSKLKIKNVLFSLLRYLIFSHQFFFLAIVFNVEAGYFTLMALIFSTYILASIIPALPFFDWLIKGSAALYLFTLIHTDEAVIITITMLMWILNFGIPAMLGSFFVLNFNVNKQE